jgi:hypothetical protein
MRKVIEEREPEVRNVDIIIMVSELRLRYIDIAKQMGISRQYLSLLMRYELSPENRERVLRAIRELQEKEALKAQIATDTNVGSKDGDTIYRQDAILAVKSRDWLTEGAKEALTDRLEKLPSAQPEIIRCGQCKYAEVADKEDAQDGYTCQFHRGSVWFSGSYCSWAERRPDGFDRKTNGD